MIEFNVGEVLKVEPSFKYSGPAFSGYKCHAAIGKKGVTFDEIIFSESPELDVPASPTPTTYTIPHGYMDIPISDAIAPGDYEVYAKLTGIPGGDLFWYGPIGDIRILSSAPQFTDFKVVYSKL